MPQLEVATYASQIFWLIVTFVTLYWLLSRRALPRVAEILEARQDRVAADLDQAQRLRTEAEEALRSYEQQMGEARSHAQRTAAETHARLQEEAARRQTALEDELGRKIAQAEREIQDARRVAMSEVEAAAVAAARAAVHRLAGLEVNDEAAKAALQNVRGEAA